MPSDTTDSSKTCRLGDFEILRELGRGGMGVVYEARQVSLNRKVALKVLAGGLGLTPQAVVRFRREAEAAARLHHTNIVPVYATGEQEGTHFYAMELIEGPSLDQVIREARLAPKAVPATTPQESADAAAETTPHINKANNSSGGSSWSTSSIGSSGHYFDTAARLMAEVADALDYAHRQGVIHRDIKPSNMMVSPDGRWSLNDFGLARLLEQPGMTMTGEFVGTPAYMSPEQIVAGRVPLDHRTDIYSLGATLYEVLTLERPFQGEQRDQVLSQIIHKEPRPPRRINKKVPLDLETICLKALDKDPDRRYQTAGAMAEDLRRYVNRFAIGARRLGPIGRVRKWARRHPGLTAGIACACVGILFASFFAYQAHRVEQLRLIEQELAKVQLATERRDRALENALVAATSGDLDKAEQAISDAEANGATPAHVRMLRGEVAYFRGDFESAFVELQQAVKLNPNSAASVGLLALTDLGLMDFARYEENLVRLYGISPITTEDYLFQGYAHLYGDRERGLTIMDEAVKKSRSPLAWGIRAALRSAHAEDHSNLQDAERALNDINAAKEHLADNPFVLSVSVMAHMVAANLYAEGGQQEKRAAVWLEAERDVLSLERWEVLAYPNYVRWKYFDRAAQQARALEVARRGAEEASVSTPALQYIFSLCRHGKFTEALREIDLRKRQTQDGEYLRAYILAELHPDQLGIARAAAEKMSKQYTSGSGFDNYARTLRVLGYKDEAVAITRKVKGGQSPRGDGWQQIVDYCSGNISEDELLRISGSRWIHFYANYHVALDRLAVGDRTGARAFLRRATDNTLLNSFDTDFARTFLIRLDQDPAWPPWIP